MASLDVERESEKERVMKALFHASEEGCRYCRERERGRENGRLVC